MPLVRVELRPGGVADDPQPVGDSQAAVARERRATARVDAVRLEPELVEREVAPDGEQDRVALDARAVGQLDDVRAVRPGTRVRSHRTAAEPDRDPILTEHLGDHGGVSRVVRGRQPIARLHDRHRHAEPGKALGELAAGGAAAEHEEALRQLACERRLAVRPERHGVEARDGRDARHRAHGDHDLTAGDAMDGAVMADLDDAPFDDLGRAAIGDRAGLLERLDVRRVVRLAGGGRSVDHPVPPV